MDILVDGRPYVRPLMTRSGPLAQFLLDQGPTQLPLLISQNLRWRDADNVDRAYLFDKNQKCQS